MKEIILLFKGVDRDRLNDPGIQLQRVLEFRKQVEEEKSLLFKTFDTKDEFERILRALLSQWVRDHRRQDWGERPITPPPPPAIVEKTTQLSIQPEGDPLQEAERLANDGKLTEAEVALARATAGGESPSAFLAYGRFLIRAGRLDHALVLLEHVLEASFSEDDERASAYRQVGAIHLIRGDLAKAEEFHLKALGLDEKLGKQEGMANDYGSLGNVYLTRGDLAKAEEFYLKSLGLSEKLGKPEGMANNYGNLGSVYLMQGDLAKAEEFHLKAHSLDEKLGKQEGMADNYGNLGNVYLTRGDLAKAEAFYVKALHLNQTIGRLRDVAQNEAYLKTIAGMRMKGGEVLQPVEKLSPSDSKENEG